MIIVSGGSGGGGINEKKNYRVFLLVNYLISMARLCFGCSLEISDKFYRRF